MLGISINEFLAGEDIAQENIVKKSEENIIGVATDSKHKQNRLKSIIRILIVASIITIAIIGVMVFRAMMPKNYLSPVTRDSIEMRTAEMLSGAEGAFMYKYTTTDEYKSLIFYIFEYHSGELVKKENVEIG